MEEKLQGVVERKNPLVFLDITIDGERAGRIVIELRKDVVPKTAENFRMLCTGERGIGVNGRPLHYKGCKFHKAISQFMVQCGDIVYGDGSGGESVYGQMFEDENFTLPHEAGVVCMANRGERHTNGSQFCIATIPCEHLAGTNVVFGKVLAGMGLVNEIQKYGQGDDNAPIVDCVIDDCGEIVDVTNWGLCCCDETADTMPEYPEDCYNYHNITVADAMKSITNIKQSGNHYFGQRRYKTAIRKYIKCLRHIDYLKDRIYTANHISHDDTSLVMLSTYSHQCHLNLAACYLQIQKYDCCIRSCNQVLDGDFKNEKALYRRGRAFHALKDYENALIDLKMAARLEPNNKLIQKLLNQVMDSLKMYNDTQRKRLSKIFRS